MKRTLFLIFYSALAMFQASAQEVTITFRYDRGSVSSSVAQTAERNLSALLTAMNDACESGSSLNLQGIGMNDFARQAVTRLWQNVKFRVSPRNFKDNNWLWVFSNIKRMQVNNIHLEIHEDSPLDGDPQDAIVEFDLTGKISDFYFAPETHSGESLGNTTDESRVVDALHQGIIAKWMGYLRTAYNNKDIDFLNRVFSDDALIITGNVQLVGTAESGMTQKVNYNRQTKSQYLRNVQRCFARNRWIKVEFSPIEDTGNSGIDKYITHRRGKDGNDYYGVRVKQSWKSRDYHDEGYLFVLWEFLNDDEAIIHIRTWQPENVGPNDIFAVEDFVELQ